jgi:hypothetical protein
MVAGSISAPVQRKEIKMYIRLTDLEGNLCIFNMRHIIYIEDYLPGSRLHSRDGDARYVKETVETIFRMLKGVQ